MVLMGQIAPTLPDNKNLLAQLALEISAIRRYFIHVRAPKVYPALLYSRTDNVDTIEKLFATACAKNFT
ncbi:hypothetical protein E2562_038128 [Oryza meyeriana var. granulata]|uniref:Uncharacterized protein n=1 Tax=Oryza meyeriana var. granulata TaxID=110450 RepID=A0A6G1F233_9ORYZ|nr:hypothetical protein E2562_038128 [Oryza meyeriana var. granulata]